MRPLVELARAQLTRRTGPLGVARMSLVGWNARPLGRRFSCGNIVATLAAEDASDASAKARNLDDPDAPVSILHARTRLRALWAVWPVVVRVHSSA